MKTNNLTDDVIAAILDILKCNVVEHQKEIEAHVNIAEKLLGDDTSSRTFDWMNNDDYPAEQFLEEYREWEKKT